MESAVILLSGGIGSTVAAYRRRDDALLHPLYLDYQRASRKAERRAATAVAEALGAPLQVLDLPHVAQIAAASSATPPGGDRSQMPPPGPPAQVDGLTATMLAVGAEYAAAVGADVLVSGQTAIVPDQGSAILSQERTVNPRELHHAFSIVLEAALPAVRAVRLATPLIDLQTVEVVKLGLRLEVPLGLSWSCHRDAPPCGTCPGCQTRRTAFAAAGAPDPCLELSAR